MSGRDRRQRVVVKLAAKVNLQHMQRTYCLSSCWNGCTATADAGQARRSRFQLSCTGSSTPNIGYEAFSKLAGGEHPATSWLGIGLAIASLIIMPFLGTAKKRLGARLDSEATTRSGVRNLLCAYLAAAVLAGLLANTVLGWWWLDPAIGLGIAGWAVREGIESWRGEE
jgi:hypothetical protein